MKKNPLLIAVLVLAVLGGFVYYTSENPPEPETDTVPLVRVEEGSIREVTVTKADGETITVVREADGPWSFGEGVSVPADDSAIDLMITNLASLDASRMVLEEASDWTPYGLEGVGRLQVTFEAGDQPAKTIVFGDDTPTGSAIFARIDGDPRLFTTFDYVPDNFDKTVFDWRDKRFLRVDSDTLETISVEMGSRNLKFAKGEYNWRIVEPESLRGDRLAVSDLDRELTSAQMTSVLAEGDAAAAAEYSTDRPYAVAEIVDGAGTHTLTIAEGGPSGYYAVSSDLPGGVYEAPAEFAESLDKELDEYRSRDLFDFGFGELMSIAVRDGDTSATLEKRQEQWLLTSDEDREVSGEKVQTLIDALRTLKAVSFPSNDAADQERYGLDTPAMEITAAALALPDPETVSLSDLSAQRVYAARAGEGETYEVEKASAEAIREALAAILEPDPPEEAATE